MSDTPRTDAAQFTDDPKGQVGFRVDACFAQQLERELAEMTKERDALHAMLDRIADTLFNADNTIGGEPYDDYIIRMVRSERRSSDKILSIMRRNLSPENKVAAISEILDYASKLP